MSLSLSPASFDPQKGRRRNFNFSNASSTFLSAESKSCSNGCLRQKEENKHEDENGKVVASWACASIVLAGKVAVLSKIEYIAGREMLHYRLEEERLEPDSHLVAQLGTLAVNEDQK